jgi:hypothetical protein
MKTTSSTRRAIVESLENKTLLANLFVAVNGVDTNPGTIDRPFASIKRAASAARPGDNVLVRGGTYSPTTQVFIGSRGTESARIRFINYNGEQVVIDGSRVTGNSVDTVSIMGANVDFGGMTVRNSKNIGIVLVNASGIRIHDVTSHNNFNLGIAAWGKDAAAYNNITIENNTLFENAAGKKPANSSTPGATGAIGITGGSNVVVRGNTIYKNHGTGVVMTRSGPGAVIEANNICDSYGNNIYLMNQVGATVTRNFIHTTRDPRFFRYNDTANGIQIGTESTQHAKSSGNLVTNNIIVGARQGFSYGNFAVGGGLINSVVANNTFINCTQASIWIDNDTHANSRVVNNLISQNNSAWLAFVPRSAGVTFSRNLWWGQGTLPATASSPTDLRVDPLLNGGRTNRASSFVPRAGSPALNIATRDNAAKVDFNKRNRSATGVDLGAVEV